MGEGIFAAVESRENCHFQAGQRAMACITGACDGPRTLEEGDPQGRWRIRQLAKAGVLASVRCLFAPDWGS